MIDVNSMRKWVGGVVRRRWSGGNGGDEGSRGGQKKTPLRVDENEPARGSERNIFTYDDEQVAQPVAVLTSLFDPNTVIAFLLKLYGRPHWG
jgi:hypothetical protein